MLTVGRPKPIENPYESPQTGAHAHSRPQPPRESSRIGWVIGLSLFAVVLGGSTGRTVPGGPFISLTGDILPTIAALFAIRLALLTLRCRGVAIKLVAMLFVLVSTFALSNVFMSVYCFWFLRSHARGDLFGF